MGYNFILNSLLYFIFSGESQDNPFLAGGELMLKADYILCHSTISRHLLNIADPDLLNVNEPEAYCDNEDSGNNSAEDESSTDQQSENLKFGYAINVPERQECSARPLLSETKNNMAESDSGVNNISYKERKVNEVERNCCRVH